MNNSTEKRAEGYSGKRVRRRRIYKITSILAILVVFCTTYALILPAITMDQDLYECGMEEHIHTDECLEQVLICTIEEPAESETETVVYHTHTNECYTLIQGDLICGLEESDGIEETNVICNMEETIGHIHEETCFEIVSNIICTTEETIEGAEDGTETHIHSEECYMEEQVLVCEIIEEAAHTHVESCFETVLTDAHEHEIRCYEWGQELNCTLEEIEAVEVETEAVHIHTDECYTQKCLLEEHTHSEECVPVYQMESVFAEDNMEITITLSNENGVPHNTNIELTRLGVDSEEYAAYEKAASENLQGEMDFVSAYSVNLTQAGEKIDSSDMEVSVKVTATKFDNTSELFEVSDEELADTSANHFLTLQMLGDEIVEGANATIEAGSEDEAVMIFNLGSSESFAVTRSVEAYPLFTIQYYANLNRVAPEAAANEPHVAVINTAKGSGVDDFVVGEGGYLPVNGNGTGESPTPVPVYRLPLEQTANGDYRVKMQLVPTEIYQTQTGVLYSNSMTVEALDILLQNDHYFLEFIRTQTKEQLEEQQMLGVTVLDERFWTRYEVGGENIYDAYYFTNDPAAVEVDGKKPIVISEGMTMRYVYHPTEDPYLKETPTNFFDYDISNGNHTTSGSVKTMNTLKQGINSHSTGNGTYLSFGNVNTGSGLAENTWTDSNGVTNTFNQYNRTGSGYMGCTFGIVSGYDWVTKHIEYANGIEAPSLFSYQPNGVTGKTSYIYSDESGSTMNFTRYGDTYTLHSVSGNQGLSADNLDTFRARTFGTRVLYSNDFWPMDNVYNKDIHFGDRASYSGGTKKFAGTYTGNLPLSDDDLEHNSYFGLQFEVDFHLDGTYDGPLNYLFYGDDDMWVFLTDRTDPNNPETHLIADIGGVHSSVGSFTNLWEWVVDTEDRPNGRGEYTLSFFYTERGASGSSCYMQFTIPGAMGTPILTGDTGELMVKKTVKDDAEYTGEFTFDYDIDSGISRYYPFTIYEDGEEGQIVVNEGSLLYSGQFSLKKNQYIVIKDLPIGTTYTVKEVYGDYTPKWTYPADASYDNEAVVGVITSIERINLECENALRYKLPDTGGEGRGVYTLGGVLLMGIAIILLYEKHRRRAIKD